MVVRILAIDDAAPDQRTDGFGKYRVVIEADGTPHTFLYTVALPSSGGQSISWEPRQSFMTDADAVPVLVVASISDAVVRHHRDEVLPLPLAITPELPGNDTVVLRL